MTWYHMPFGGACMGVQRRACLGRGDNMMAGEASAGAVEDSGKKKNLNRIIIQRN